MIRGDRFQPARIIAVDRDNNRVVHLSLGGEFLGVVASDLLLPAAITLSGENVVVGELSAATKPGRTSTDVCIASIDSRVQKIP